MVAGVAGGLQNRIGVRAASRVGSIPTRSRHTLVAVACRRPMIRQALRVLVGLALLLGFAVGLPGMAWSQDGEPAGVPVPPPGDSLAADSAAAGLPSETRAEPSAESGSRPSPMGSLLRSVVVPGWGQYATGHPVRGAFYLLAEGAALVMVFDRQSQLNDARAATPQDSVLIASRTQAREDWIVAAAIIALVSGVDAWASAHLWGFEGEIVQPPDGALGMAYQVSIPLGGR